MSSDTMHKDFETRLWYYFFNPITKAGNIHLAINVKYS